MQRPNNLKVGDRFTVIERNNYFNVGEIISLKDDDGSTNPDFWSEDKSYFWCISFSDLEPHTKTVRDAQVGDVVVCDSREYMVLERWRSTILLSYADEFKKAASAIYTFDEMESYYTLKNAPDVKSAKTAEAMKLLKEAGYKVSKE